MKPETRYNSEWGYEVTHYLEKICDILRKEKIKKFEQENGTYEIVITNI